jgi:FkbM family methyltransferase
MNTLRQWLGLLRSLVIYYGNPLQQRRMRLFYAQFIQPGDLCFDIGAHVGNRLRAWSTLGGQVVGVEPQPACMALLRWWYGGRRNVTLVEAAVGAVGGQQSLWISAATPTVTTLSRPWIESVQQSASFAHVRWENEVTVAVVTLDELIARYGEPIFCKIDIEGYELEALRGLSRPLAVLSFEYLPASKEIAVGCVARLQALGDYEFNWSAGEEHRWQSTRWLSDVQMIAMLTNLTLKDNSGDIYARRR